MQALTISRAAREAGVNIETVRFYERRGLVERPPKGEGYRIYSPDQVVRIRFIKEAQQIGFSLSQIGELLTLRADPAADCSDVRQQAITKREEVRRKIERLQQIDAALETLLAACPGSGALEMCSIMDALSLRARQPAGPEKTPRSRSQVTSATEHRMKTAILKIEGTHCDGCATTIKTVLEREPGVQMAAVSFAEGEARVLYDPHAATEDRLVATIEKPGFRLVGRQ
jgi:MerR family transcriptional regulator, copper efflux regulator